MLECIKKLNNIIFLVYVSLHDQLILNALSS